MRGVLESPSLVKHAGRFVWLELNFDKPANRAFLRSHRVSYTPTFLVVDPVSERTTAIHFGSMTLGELEQFLDLGERGFRAHGTSPADSAFARANEELGRGDLEHAVASDRVALARGGPQWPARPHVLAQLVSALSSLGESRACAETAAAEAPRIPRSRDFVNLTRDGLQEANQDSAGWAHTARVVLAPLAAEAVNLPEADADSRFQLYSGLHGAAELEHDAPARERWKQRWLADLDSIQARTDDERTALDIARVEAASELEEFDRFVPALEASERKMPHNYVPSLRLAQILAAGKRWDDAIAACERGLSKVDGPLGRSWLLQIEGRSWIGKGERDRARAVLVRARSSADSINVLDSRENNLRRIDRSIAGLAAPPP